MKNFKKILWGLLFYAIIFNSYKLHAGGTTVESTTQLQSMMANMFFEVSESDITTSILYGSKILF